MRKFAALLLCIALVFSITLPFNSTVKADELDEINKKIDDLNKSLQMSKNATTPLESTLSNMDSQINQIQKRLDGVANGIEQKKKELVALEEKIKKSETELSYQEEILARRVRLFYIRSKQDSPFVIFLNADIASSMTRELAYRQAATQEDRRIIVETVLFLKGLEDDKKEAQRIKTELESEQSRLAVSRAKIDKEAEFYRKEIAGAKAYQSQLESTIADLTSRQQSLLAERSGTFTTSVGDVPLTDDPNASPNFNPGFSPAFGGFSFGAYTHRKGMSQYGAKGRAESGQSANNILQAYYGRTPVGKDTGGTISVSGYGSLNFESYYLYGIAEMPSNFPNEALKAQAIAARSYAYTYKTSGQTICPTESCQVFSKSKADSPPSAWKQAVDDTRGQVVEGVTAFYSSTTGGYLLTMGWDTKCGNQGCWTGDAYEKIANSPWFYKGWYTQNYYNSSAKCGRSHPWLNGEEFADILNAWVVRQKGTNDDRARILPTTINSCPIGGSGGNPFSIGEMRDKASSLGGAYSSVSSVSVSYSTSGVTASVSLNTDRGSITINGSEFKDIFNLRAPGYISIRSPLYNLEKR